MVYKALTPGRGRGGVVIQFRLQNASSHSSLDDFQQGPFQCPAVLSTGLNLGMKEKDYVYVPASDDSEGDDSEDCWGVSGKF